MLNKILALCVLVLLSGLTACEKADGPKTTDPLADLPNGTEPDRPRDVRPRAATSGMSSDPNNPSGIPGPSSGLGTSNSRY
jgi:hypothetical protein